MKNIGSIGSSPYRRSVDKRLFHLPRPAGTLAESGRYFSKFESERLNICEASALMIAAGGADAGGDAVYQAAAQLLAGGGEPAYADIQVFINAETDEQILHKIFDGAALACSRLGMIALSADAFAIPETVNRHESCLSAVINGRHDAADEMPSDGADNACFTPVISVRVSGSPDAMFTPEKPVSGQDIIMAGYAGWYGSRILAIPRAAELREHFNEEFIAPLLEDEDSFTGACPDIYYPGPSSLGRIIRAAAAAGVRSVYAAGEGGIFTAVWNMAESGRLGARIMLEDVLLRQETVEVCDLLDVNPYLLMSQGVVIMAAEHGQRVLGEFAAAGIPAALIGYFTDDNDRVVINGEDTRFLEPFKGDSLYSSGML